MRFRAVVIAAAVLSLAAPSTAFAATGDLEYEYGFAGHTLGEAELSNPESRECIEIPVVEDISDAYAYRPRNKTNATVTLFKDSECTGAYYSLRPGGKASTRLLFRSVVFS